MYLLKLLLKSGFHLFGEKGSTIANIAIFIKCVFNSEVLTSLLMLYHSLIIVFKYAWKKNQMLNQYQGGDNQFLLALCMFCYLLGL